MGPAEAKRSDGGSFVRGSELLFVASDFAFARYRDAIVMCHPARPVSSASWTAWVQWASTHPYRCLLVSSHGGGPNSGQRTQLAQASAESGIKPETVALLSDSAVLRGILTAIAWLTSNTVKPFSPGDLAGALQFLGLSEHSIPIETLVMQLHAAIAQAT
jgi:hypothetical protein